MKTDYDVIVVGLGTAGAMALICAAKHGARVLGIERLNAMGGTATLGYISAYCLGSPGGLFEEIDKEADDFQKAFFAGGVNALVDSRQYVLEQTAAKHGADILYDAIVTGVSLSANTVTGLEIFSKGRFHTVNAKFVIDCTGEADICVMACCETMKGRASDGQTQPFTNAVVLVEDGDTKAQNIDTGYVDQSVNASLSQDVVRSLTIKSFLLDDYKDHTNFTTNAALLGIREGKTIVGEETLTLEKYFRDEVPKNPVFYAYANLDHHGKDTAFEDGILCDWYAAAGLWSVNFSVAVPMGALIPKGYKGLLAAGRCLSVDHNLASCVRMRRDMQKAGEAAGVMAVLSIKNGVEAKDLDYRELSCHLEASGCLSRSNDVGLTKKTQTGLQEFSWLTDADEIKKGLSGRESGIAIWSAKRLGESLSPCLINWLGSDDESLSVNSAIALALLGRKEALPVLRALAAKRDFVVPVSDGKYVYTRAVSAIYLLGRLADAESIDRLFEVIKERGAFDETNFTPDELHSSADDVRFLNFSYAAAALVNIAKARPDCRERIFRFLDEHILQQDFPLAISLKANSAISYEMLGTVKNFIALKKSAC